MRLVLGLATAASLVAATPSIADACSAPVCWPGLMTPNAATPVPKNLPAIYWKPQGGYNGEAADPSMVVLANASAPSTPLPFTATALGDRAFVLVPTDPLVEGATYTVTDNNQCELTTTIGPTATFQVAAQAGLPSVSGTLRVQSESHAMIDVATSSGSCSAEVFAHRVDLTLDLQSSALPWAAAFHHETYVDDVLWSRSESILSSPSVYGTWRLYRVCDAMNEYDYNSGLGPGVHQVKVKTTLPGTTIELWTEPVDVVMACPGEGVDVNGDGDGDDEASGCSASGRSTSMWLLLALVGLYSGRRKRQR